jgi:hypothetical protein
MCHVATSWVPAFVDPATIGSPLTDTTEHESRFPIRVGPHRDMPCTQCHLSPDVPRVVECTGCHAHDPVRMREVHHGELVALDASGCLGCHPGGSAR